MTYKEALENAKMWLNSIKSVDRKRWRRESEADYGARLWQIDRDIEYWTLIVNALERQVSHELQLEDTD